jgi:hypothetical protein
MLLKTYDLSELHEFCKLPMTSNKKRVKRELIKFTDSYSDFMEILDGELPESLVDLSVRYVL